MVRDKMSRDSDLCAHFSQRDRVLATRRNIGSGADSPVYAIIGESSRQASLKQVLEICRGKFASHFSAIDRHRAFHAGLYLDHRLLKEGKKVRDVTHDMVQISNNVTQCTVFFFYYLHLGSDALFPNKKIQFGKWSCFRVRALVMSSTKMAPTKGGLHVFDHMSTKRERVSQMLSTTSCELEIKLFGVLIPAVGS